MELRTLRYYLAVCECGTMSRAAERLHVTQPALSRQIAALERELGCELFERHSRSVAPTEQGLFLLRRAQEIVDLADRTAADFACDRELVAGDIHIGAGESDGMRAIAAQVRAFRERYPGVRFHLHSGNAPDLIERLERGLDDFAVLMSQPDMDRFAHIRLRPTDAWGVIMRADDPLAAHDTIAPSDLAGRTLIMTERAYTDGQLHGVLATWMSEDAEGLDVAATYNLAYNAAQLAREGVGLLLTYEGLVASGPGTDLAFRLLYPPAVSTIDFAWKHDRAHSNAARLFLDRIRQTAACPA